MAKTVASSSSSTISSDGVDKSDTKDSCYFPGCRKDANCTCDICLASINATLDLIHSTTTARSKIENPPKNNKLAQKTPIPFDSRVLSTPISKNMKPVSALQFDSKEERERRRWGIGWFFILGILVLGVGELGFSWGVSRVLRPELSAEMVTNVVEESRVLQDFDGKLGFLQRELRGLVKGEVFDCGSNGSVWKINQDDLLLNSQCTLYKSATEEVSLWGWPLQTAGLLTAGFSSRSFTILSGRVTEWSNGKASNLTVKTNQSWVHKRWSASAVQFDKNTWIVEYKRAQMIENTSLISAALEFLNFRLTKTISRIKHEFWFLPDFRSHYSSINGDNFKVPT